MGAVFQLAGRQPCRAAAAVARRPQPRPALHLQRVAGNAALGRLLNGLRLQPKLTINQPGDAYEREADRVTDQVMRMPDGTAASRDIAAVSSAGVALQRCACGGTTAGGEPCAACQGHGGAHEEEDGRLHRLASAPTAAGVAPPIVHAVLNSPGKPLDAATRAFMEPRFGRNFGSVRVHTDTRAAASARAVHAHAYAVGTNVVFGAERYRPETPGGRWLLAHELAHVVGQGGAAPVLRRYDESTEPNTELGQGLLDVASILPAGAPLFRGLHAFFCLRPLEQPMRDLTFDRWVRAVCAREHAPRLHNRTWDSFGHCWIGCEASRKCGRSAAAIVGTSREYYRELQRVLGIAPHDSFKQDLANQRTGRALSFVPGTCYSLCDRAYLTGGLDLSAPEGTCIDCAAQVEGACPP